MKAEKMLFSIYKNKETRKSLEINKKDFDYFYMGEYYEWYIKGHLFYLMSEKGISKTREEIDSERLNILMNSKKFDPKSIKETLEGHYVCVIRNRERIIVFGDKFNRLNLFYTHDNQRFYFNCVLSKELVNKSGTDIDEKYVYSFFLIGYGHASSTLFKNIKRLGYEDVLLYDKTLHIKNISSPAKIEDYGSEKLKEFEDLFIQSVKSRMEPGVNFVSNSGGWDSTLMLDVLHRLKEKKNIRTAIWETKLKDGRIHNIYEVEKVKRIASHYGIKNFVFQIDHSDKKLIDKWKEFAHQCFAHHVFQWPINHLGLFDFIKQTDSSTKAIFNGETCDSFHNFGFSQYASIHSGNNDFDEYADKMKTYLYGPSFMKEVSNDSFRENKIYQIFKRIYDHIEFNDQKNDYSNLMISFIYSPSRLPFTLPEETEIFEKDTLISFLKKAVDEYFSKYLKKINFDNIYSIWTSLYADFHFKGLSVPMSLKGIEDVGMTAALPYFDLCLARFFEKMPESWGRGLNFNPAKYPAKMMAYKSKTFPLHIVGEDKPHSYLSEADPHLNPFYEFYCNSSVTDYFRDILNRKDILDFLHVEGIHSSFLEKVRSDMVNNKKIEMSHFQVISKICTLSSIVTECLK